ncbi:MAG TPA: hypothetical protein VGX50_09060, partial [Longimicrobium sp.]|nr:hypothetical protein [Longimicrobium sp.]
MSPRRLLSTLTLTAAALAAAPAAAQNVSRYRPAADSLIRAATADSAAWKRIAELVDRFGPRFSGTPQLEQHSAIDRYRVFRLPTA